MRKLVCFWFQIILFIVFVGLQFNDILNNARNNVSFVEAGNNHISNKDCFDSSHNPDWWIYVWCPKISISQIHYNHATKSVEFDNLIGSYMSEESSTSNVHEIYRNDQADCWIDETQEYSLRYAEVSIECCEHHLNIDKTKDVIITDESTSGARNTKLQLMKKGISIDTTGTGTGRVDFIAKTNTYIDSVVEAVSCSYYIKVCSKSACNPNQSLVDALPSKGNINHIENSSNVKSNMSVESNLPNYVNDDASDAESNSLLMSLQRQTGLKERVKAMFYKSYDSYMIHALPFGELKPISCEGGNFDLIKIPMVTLIDTLDTLVVMGNHSEFRRGVSIILNQYSSFNLDVNVSVFETTIRILGGLLSAHLMAIDPVLDIYENAAEKKETVNVDTAHYRTNREHGYDHIYDGGLLSRATDLGNRLLPAFRTKTGIPYGTVNLRYGIPRGETEIASTAGAGSLLMEFAVLSYLTGDAKHELVASKAVRALHNRRSSIGLLGKHIHTKSGLWSETTSGIGSNSDSYYEYLLKAHLLSQQPALMNMFSESFAAIKRHVQEGDWFGDVDMFSGKMRRNRIENLHAFWPGMEALLGFTESTANTLNALFAVWREMTFLPEEFDQSQWQPGKPNSAASVSGYYPLRPELIESTYFQYRTTGDRSWLSAGELFFRSIEEHSQTNCGYASVGNISSKQLVDMMPSFFLSETCKYLYLLFDEDNFVHDRPYLFTTEAHPFDLTQLFQEARHTATANRSSLRAKHALEYDEFNRAATTALAPAPSPLLPGKQPSVHTQPLNPVPNPIPVPNPVPVGGGGGGEAIAATSTLPTAAHGLLFSLPTKCPKSFWWDVSTSYNPNYYSSNNSNNLNTNPTGEEEGEAGEDSTISYEKKLIQDRNFNIMKIVKLNLESSFRSEYWDRIYTTGSKPVEGDDEGDRHRDALLLSRLVTNQMCADERAYKLSPQSGAGAGAGIDIKYAYRPWDICYFEDLVSETPVVAYFTNNNIYSNGNAQAAAVAAAHQQQLVHQQQQLQQTTPLQSVKKTTFSTLLSLLSPFIPASIASNNNMQKLPAPSPNPNLNMQKASPNASPNPSPSPGAVQTLEIAVGDLGMFLISVYVDGFEIKSAKSGDIIEVSSVGQSVVFVKEYNDENEISQVEGGLDEGMNFKSHVIGDISGNAIRCFVQIVVDHDSSSNSYEIGGDVVWERACSVSAFMPIRSMVVSGELHIPEQEDLMLCRPLQEQEQTASADEGTSEDSLGDDGDDDTNHTEGAALDGDGIEGEGVPSPPSSFAARFLRWPWRKKVSSPSPILSPSPSDSVDSNGESAEPVYATSIGNEGNLSPRPKAPRSSPRPRIVMGIRGDCMFEEKALNAQAGGADGVIIANTEEVLFIMSGKSGLSLTVLEDETPSNATPVPEEEVFIHARGGGKVVVPTVMLSSVDAQALLAAYKDPSRGRGRSVRICIDVVPAALDNDIMGHATWPKISVTTNVIAIQGRSDWGALIVSTQGQGKDWQLYILSKADMSSGVVNPVAAFTARGLPLTTTPSFTTSSLDMYANYISRTCPSDIAVRGQKISFRS